MNDDEMLTLDADPMCTEECDPLPQAGEDPLGAEDEVNEEARSQTAPHVDRQASDEDREVSADPVSDPDPDPASPPAASAEEQLEQLRGELTRLRAEIAAKDAFLDRVGAECEEFHALYPEAALSELPDGVWRDVGRGIPLAAAYALAERRRAYTAQQAAISNRENGARSSGALEPTEKDYFSPSEVRAMSQSEVRTNYQKIMRSMQKWR